MSDLKFEIDIAADPKKVWNTMLDLETYKQWVANAWPDSGYKGEFKQGTEISFVGPDGSGMLAEVNEVKPHDSVKVTHIAVLGPGGQRDSTSDFAKDWVGIEENYYFKKERDKTHVVVELKKIPSQFQEMFADTWPIALKDLKNLCEN